jgi:hypothetical protein
VEPGNGKNNKQHPNVTKQKKTQHHSKPSTMSNNAAIITLAHDALSHDKVSDKQAVDFHRFEKELRAQDEVTREEMQAAKATLVDVRSRVIQAGNKHVQSRMGKRAERTNLKHADGVATVTNYPELKIMWKKKRDNLTLSLLCQVFEVVYPRPDTKWLQKKAVQIMADTNIHIPSTSTGQFGNFVEEIIHKNCLKGQRKFTQVSRSDKAKVGLMARPSGAHPMDRHCDYQPKSSFFQYQHINGWLDLVETDPVAGRIWDAYETGTLKDNNSSVAFGVRWVNANNHFPGGNSPIVFSLSDSSDSGETNKVTMETTKPEVAPAQATARAPIKDPPPPITGVTIGIAKNNQDVGDWDSLTKKMRNDDLSTLNGSACAPQEAKVQHVVLLSQLVAISLET